MKQKHDLWLNLQGRWDTHHTFRKTWYFRNESQGFSWVDWKEKKRQPLLSKMFVRLSLFSQWRWLVCRYCPADDVKMTLLIQEGSFNYWCLLHYCVFNCTTGSFISFDAVAVLLSWDFQKLNYVIVSHTFLITIFSKSGVNLQTFFPSIENNSLEFGKEKYKFAFWPRVTIKLKQSDNWHFKWLICRLIHSWIQLKFAV